MQDETQMPATGDDTPTPEAPAESPAATPEAPAEGGEEQTGGMGA